MRARSFSIVVAVGLLLGIVWALGTEHIEARGSGIVRADGQRYSTIIPTDYGELSACAVCHQLGPNEPPRSAPSLYAIVDGRRARSPWFGYSEALRNSGGEWTREALDAYLADPVGYLPGTSKTISPIRDADRRQRIVDALAQLGHTR